MKSIFLESHNIKNRAGGLGTFNYELIKAISEANLEALKITLNTSDIKTLKNEFGTTFKYQKYTSLQRHPLFRLRKKYDVWHSLNQNTKIEPGTKPKKYILTVHDVNFVEEHSKDMSHKKNRMFIEKIKRAEVITYISEFARKQTHQYFDIPNIEERIIYNGNPIREIIDLSHFKNNITIETPFFYTIGDFIERKNFTSLIEMMRLMPNYNLFISGNHNKEYGETVKNLIKKYNLEKNIFLTGKISEEGKQFYMQNCEAFLFPSIREGFGLPPIEAMKFGKPVFLSTLTSMPEIGGDAAFYWSNFDPEYMKDNLLQNLEYYNNNKLVLTEKIIDRSNYFDWKKAATEYIALYK